MKRSLIALAALVALGAAGVASAQSSVTVFGVVDVATSYYQTKSSFVGLVGTPALNLVGARDLKQSQWALTTGGYNSSRVGFRGTEDLGGGLAASFWLEAPISPDDGAVGIATFARRSTVSLTGGFGEVRLGRDYSAAFWNDNIFDPFGSNGVGTSLVYTMNAGPRTVTFGGVNRGLFGNANYVRTSNTVGYFLPPTLGGFYGQLQYAFNENVKYDPGNTTPATAPSRTGTGYGGRFGYANGSLDIAASYGVNAVGDNFYAGITNKVEIVNLGASYDFGPVKLFGEVARTTLKNDYEYPPLIGTGDYKGEGYLLGATVPVGPGLIRLSYSHVKLKYSSPPTVATLLLANSIPDPSSDKIAIGYVHNLSKRTALYTTAAYIKNKDGAAFNTNSNYTTSTPGFTNNFFSTGVGGYRAKSAMGYDFGIRHAF